LRAAYATPERLWLALGGPGRSERRFQAAWTAFCLACGVLAAVGGFGYALVVWVVTAMLAYGLVHTCASGRASGVDVDVRVAHVLTFEGGKCLRYVSYLDRDEALKVAGLDE